MKVLVINTVRFGINGISSVIMNFYRHIKSEDIQFEFVVNSVIESSFREEIESRNDVIHIIDNRNKKVVSYIKKLKKIISNGHYDIIHIHGNSALMMIELVAAKADPHAITMVHAHNTSCSHKFLNKVLYKSFINSYDYALACSEAAGKWLYGDNPHTVINNGIDEIKFEYNSVLRKKERRKNGYADDKYVILHVGLFNEQKNHTFLIDVFRLIADIDDNAVLRLVGKGNKIGEITKKVNTLGLSERVEFVGVTETPEIEYNMADVFVFPSLFESFGLVTVEAQSTGLPCVLSTGVPETIKITENVDFLPLDTDLKIWAETVLKYKAERNRVGCGKEVRENNYSIAAEAVKLENLYRDTKSKGKK